jgi:hypothetical protein
MQRHDNRNAPSAAHTKIITASRSIIPREHYRGQSRPRDKISCGLRLRHRHKEASVRSCYRITTGLKLAQHQCLRSILLPWTYDLKLPNFATFRLYARFKLFDKQLPSNGNTSSSICPLRCMRAVLASDCMTCHFGNLVSSGSSLVFCQVLCNIVSGLSMRWPFI